MSIKVGYPELNGVILRINDQSLQIFPEKENDKLTEQFLDTLLLVKKRWL